MRVALLSYRSKPHCGGQGIYLRHLSRELVALGHEVEVFSGQPYPVLDEGVRLMSNLVKDEEGYPSIDPEDVSIGMKVRVVFHDVTDEITLPKFVAA